LAAILDVDDHHAGIAPGRIDAIVVIDDLVPLHDLRLAIWPVAVERAELLAFLLAGDVPGGAPLDPIPIPVVVDLQASPLELGRELRARIDVAIVDIEAVGLAVGRDWHERELFRLGRIGHVVERHARSCLLTRRLLVGIAARVEVVAEDEDLLLPVDAQIIAARTRIARDEGERLDVLRIAHVRNQYAEQRGWRVETAQIRNAVIDTHAVEPRAELTAWPPLPLRPGRALGDLEIGVADQLEILGRGIFLELLDREVERVDIGRNLHILDPRGDDLGGCNTRERKHCARADARERPSRHWVPRRVAFLCAYHLLTSCPSSPARTGAPRPRAAHDSRIAAPAPAA